MGTLLNRRRFLGGGGEEPLPQGAVKVEYLESTGTQYIDTGIYPDQDTGVEIEFSTSFTNSDREAFGARSYSRYYELLLDRSHYLYYQYGSSTPIIAYGTNNLNYYYNWYADKNVLRDLSNKTVLATLPEQTFSISNTLYLFGLHSSSFQRGLVGRICYCKIYSNQILVRDFIPVRVGQVGYMYDKVSGTLIGNAGTGDFVLGPEKT